MKHFITLTLLSAFLFVGSSAFAQPATQLSKKSLVLNGAFERGIIKDKEPLPYPPVRESDVIWSKTIWRNVDLRERMNYPLYYPTELFQSRRSLVQTFVQAIQEGRITAYDADADDEFTAVLSAKDVIGRFNASDRTVRRTTDDGRDTTVIIRGEINWGEVQELLIKEVWFFDKHYSQMFVRIIGICPVRVYYKELRTGGDEEAVGERTKQQLFWIYYPDARKVLANTPCFTGENETSQTSFDDVLEKRRFNSYIIAESDNQNNRKLNSFTRNDFEKMLKAEEIKSKLFNFEQDLWEY